MADGMNPFASLMSPNARQAGLWDLRMMSAANRMQTPFMRGMRGMYSHQGVGGDPMLGGLAGMVNQPDYSGFTYDPVMRQQAIDAGVQPLEASQVKQNVILPNTGFFGRHPRLAEALEGGLLSAAASHGGETTGESIQGVIEGLIGGKRIREGLYRQQFARPFEQAGALEGLRDMQQRRELQAAQIKRYQDESEIQQDRVEVERQKNLLGAERIEATRPVPVEGGTWVYGKTEAHPPTFQEPWGAAEGKPSWQFQPGKGKAKTGHQYSQGIRDQLGIMGADIENPTSAQLAEADRRWEQQQIRISGGKTGASEKARQPARAAAGREKFIKDNVGKPGVLWMTAGISPGDKDAATKLGNYYDTYIAPYTQQVSQALEGGDGSSADKAQIIP